MTHFDLTYEAFCEDALIIQWPKRIEEAILFDISAFKIGLKALFPSAIFTASYNELMLRFPESISNFKDLIRQLEAAYASREKTTYKPHLIQIPVCYEDSFGLDLEEVCAHLKMDSKELIRLHSQTMYTVYAMGFLPGFMYLGGLPKNLHHPRKTHPRPKVPKGAVGLAGMQTGIYPNESPGGWQIIGNTPLNLFNRTQWPPTFVEVGDKIQFVPIGKDEYNLIRIQVETELYKVQKKELPND